MFALAKTATLCTLAMDGAEAGSLPAGQVQFEFCEAHPRGDRSANKVRIAGILHHDRRPGLSSACLMEGDLDQDDVTAIQDY